MASRTIEYLRGVSLARKDYLSSLLQGDKSYELRMATITFILSVISITVVSFLNHFAKIWFLGRQTFEPAAQDYAATFPFPIASLIISNSLYILLLVAVTILLLGSAFIFGSKVGLIPTFTAVILSSPYFVLLYLTPSLFFLFALIPIALWIAYLFPVVVSLLWIRFVYRMGRYLFQMEPAKAKAFVFIFLSLSAFFLFLLWVFVPGGLI